MENISPMAMERAVKEAAPPWQSTMSAREEPMGQAMAHNDHDNPQNWPLHRKVYVSLVAEAFGFVVAFGVTAYTAGLTEVISEFKVSMTTAILGLSLYLWGIAFAPIITPHLTEAFGRSRVYLISLPICSLFILGAGASQTFASLAVCRFFAGLTGGPCLVLIEGTFADVWSADATVTYYSFLSLASYVGAACGPLVGGFIFASRGWRWTQWVTLMIALPIYLFGIGMPETYERTIVVRRAKGRNLLPPKLMEPSSGATISEMARVTLITPAIMLVSEPLLILASLYLGFNFAVIFQWFIAVPAVLNLVYGFTVQQAGLAFIAAIVGAILATISSTIIDRLSFPRLLRKSQYGSVDVEYRMYSAMVGGPFITASLFWIGWTADPKISWASPVVGTMFYVWGNMMVLISLVSYLFDSHRTTTALSALTAAASFRLLLAGFLPLVIIQMIMGLTGGWAYSLLGFISAAMIPIPWIIWKFGARLRMSSKHGHHATMISVPMKEEEAHARGSKSRE